jgi:hypothetical protein
MLEYSGDYNSSKLETCENGEHRVTMIFFRGTETKIFQLDENGHLYIIDGKHHKTFVHDAAAPGVRFQLEEALSELLAK